MFPLRANAAAAKSGAAMAQKNKNKIVLDVAKYIPLIFLNKSTFFSGGGAWDGLSNCSPEQENATTTFWSSLSLKIILMFMDK